MTINIQAQEIIDYRADRNISLIEARQAIIKRTLLTNISELSGQDKYGKHVAKVREILADIVVHSL